MSASAPAEHVVEVGEVAIPYSVRFSERASKRRIEVTSDGVQVIAPKGAALHGDKGVHAYVHSKRHWIYDARCEIERKRGEILTQSFQNGASLMYRGRNLMLCVHPADVERVTIEYKTKFVIQVPERVPVAARGRLVEQAMDLWLHQRAHHEAARYARKYARKLEVDYKALRVTDQKWSWGTCGNDRVLRINWQLIKAPAAAMEYVVAHEVVHLLERNHSPRFWQLIERVMPDWEARKALLERWETGPRRKV